MKSRNFEFLRARRAVLADLAGFAENYAHSDPASSLIKLRGFVEQMVDAIYQGYRLRPPFSDNLNDRMNTEEFRQSVPEVVQQKLHALRIAGNHAAHPRRPMTSQLSLERLFQAFEVAQWFHLQISRGASSDFPKWSPPPPDVATNGKAKEALEKLRLAEAKYEAMLATLEEERKKREAAEQVAAQSSSELEKLNAEGQEVAKTLSFNEETTRRRLIDQMLLDAGWNVGPNATNTDEVKQEVPVVSMPTISGEGYCDYVLYGDDGKPLAVVEAKKTAKDARIGAEQARVYATCLEKETGQRPVVFFTNGFDVFIWDDAQGYPYRKIYGFYSKDSLEYLLHQRTNKKPLAAVAPNLAIADRMYQLEAIKRVSERFTGKFRRALLVQATGTGKTRVAVSLCELLMRAGWVKRILFLCDRRELRKQADRVFKEFMPGEPRIIVSRSTSGDRDKRIYLATYPAMMECFEDFDVGFFDLIVADESHRSIYMKFQSLFRYFDALQVGLTATPVRFIERNTYQLFGCEDRDPTSSYSFQDAIEAKPPHLVPFRVRSFSSKFRQSGVKYNDMSAEQKEQAEDQDPAATLINYEADEVDVAVMNKATTRFIWQKLMEEGIRESTGSHVGKTIVFARNHNHAVHMAEVFHETYPQYGSSFCRVIDNQEKYAEDLIDNFKSNDPGRRDPLVIAISVDMLDTGIDVPEVVNLVFAKPVKSYVKFWQMIGRGTRLSKDLFGPGKHKTAFLIFDHWSNFWFFDEKYKEEEPSKQKSLLQQLFETRITLAQAALDKMQESDFQATVDLLLADIRDVKDAGNLEVKDRWRELEQLSDRGRLEQFSAPTKNDLLSIVAPLMHWRPIRGFDEAYRFDLLMTRLELELLRAGPTGGRVLDFKAVVEEQVELLMKNQNPVKAKADTINQVRSKEFWATVTVSQLEKVRLELRGIMKYQQQAPSGRVAPQILDIDDTGFTAETYIPRLEGLDLVEYKLRVEKVLKEKFGQNPVVERIRSGALVGEPELEELATLVLEADDKANVRFLVGHQPETRRSLLTVFRSLVGLDPAAIEQAFAGFVHKHPSLSAQQLRFLQVLQNYIAQNGGIELDRLYEPPFTTVHAESVDGVFRNDGEVEDLLAIISTFEPKVAAGAVLGRSQQAS
ncbi:hypothetical protein MFUL124B02_36435 [Myxococcus fulvus 124B02]|nr:hypothetical protein MFUL124B02_36435 [Myxococcus fulvus 124B02]